MRPQPARGGGERLDLSDPRLRRLIAVMLRVLGPFPDAQAALERGIAEVERSGGDKRPRPPHGEW